MNGICLKLPDALPDEPVIKYVSAENPILYPECGRKAYSRSCSFVTPFAHFAEPMAAVLADHRELARSLSAFAAF
jgi:hypothetical protein